MSKIAENSKKTARGRPFKAGQSGNPGGRPKIPQEVKDAIRAACPEAVQLLIRIMRNPRAKDEDRAKAANSLLDRGYGKPTQEQNVQMDITGMLDVRTQVRSVVLEQLGYGDVESAD